MNDETAWVGPPSANRWRTGRVARRLGLGIRHAVPLGLAFAAAFVGGGVLVAAEAGDRERERADRRLRAVADAASAEFVQAVDESEQLARRLAGDARVARALTTNQRELLTRIARSEPLVFLRRGRVVAGRVPTTPVPVRRSADVVADGRRIGTVQAYVAFDDELVERLDRASATDGFARVALIVDGAIVAGRPRARVGLASGTQTATIGASRVRAVSVPVVAGRPTVRLAALTPLEPIERAADDRRNDVLLAVAVTFVALGLLAASLLIVRRERRLALRARAIDDERRTIRDALSLVGDALASTHDTEALLPVIVHTAVEAAGATGARLLREDEEVMRAGRPSASKTPLVLPLGVDDGGRELRLLLYAAGGGPLPEARELAEWFVSQASIALENARLHGIVKRQAITDPLTGLFNRRRFVEALEAELSRAERFGTELAVVIADLDDFKNVNDSYGHEVGNDVLVTFGGVIEATLRDVDVAARLGGEEFGLLLPQTDLSGGVALAERIRSALVQASVPAPDDGRLYVTGSFGVAAYPPTATADELLRAADGALYRAKAAGKNRVERA